MRSTVTYPLVLVGFAQAFAAIETVWSLQAAGMRVAAFGRHGAPNPLALVRGVRLEGISAPESDASAAIGDLERLATELRPDAFLPLDDASLWLATNADLGGVAIIGPDEAGARLALDKSLQLKAAADAGLHTPQWTVADSAASLEPSHWPIIVKPADAVLLEDGRLGRPTGVICGNEDEFAEARARLGDIRVIAQTYLHGVGEGLFGYVTPEGVQTLSAHRRIRMVNPNGSAASACTSQGVPTDLVEPATTMLTRAGWRGLFMLEFLRDGAGIPWFMELNGRAWGSMALARRRGLEYPAWAVQSQLGLPVVPVAPSDPPHLVARHLGRELAHLAFVIRGPQSTAVASWPSIPTTLGTLLRVRRSDRLYNWNARQPWVLVADTAETLGGLFRNWRRSR